MKACHLYLCALQWCAQHAMIWQFNCTKFIKCWEKHDTFLQFQAKNKLCQKLPILKCYTTSLWLKCGTHEVCNKSVLFKLDWKLLKPEAFFGGIYHHVFCMIQNRHYSSHSLFPHETWKGRFCISWGNVLMQETR